jgi:hypothetical protein
VKASEERGLCGIMKFEGFGRDGNVVNVVLVK